MRHYSFGPFVLPVTEVWPDTWRAYAADKLHPAPEDDARPPLRITSVRHEPGTTERARIQDLDVRRDTEHPSRWWIRAEDALTAQADTDALTLEIVTHSQRDSPLLTMVNALRGAFTALLPSRFDGLMFHASSAVRSPEGAAHGVLFAGKSGRGKTTLSMALTEAKYISDDISVVDNLSTDAPRVCPSPFYGSAGELGHDVGGRFAALALLEQSTDGETRIERLKTAEAVRELMTHIVCFSADAALQQHLLDRAFDLAAHVPVLRLTRALETPADEVLARVLESVGAE